VSTNLPTSVSCPVTGSQSDLLILSITFPLSRISHILELSKGRFIKLSIFAEPVRFHMPTGAPSRLFPSGKRHKRQKRHKILNGITFHRNPLYYLNLKPQQLKT
jgi:hypothetical protein